MILFIVILSLIIGINFKNNIILVSSILFTIIFTLIRRKRYIVIFFSLLPFLLGLSLSYIHIHQDKEIFDGLQERIKDSITDELFNNEDLQSDLNDIVNRLKKNLYGIVESSISSYIINNLFTHQSDLQQQIQQTIWSMRSRGELK